MADISTIASLGTAAGTLVLALATFSSTRSANRAARVSEQTLRLGLRPVVLNARPQDEAQKISFIDNHQVLLREGLAAMQQCDDNLYFAIPLRNVAPGLAVLHGWHAWAERVGADVDHAPVEQFRRLTRDLYVPAGDIGFWQAAIRDREDPLHGPMSSAITTGESVSVDILYGDHEGGQRTITRFSVTPRSRGAEQEPWLWVCTTVRHWNLDRSEPR